MRVSKNRALLTAITMVVIAAMSTGPALAAGGKPDDVIQTIIKGRTGANADKAAATETVGTTSVGIGRHAGKALESYAQHTATRMSMMAVLTDPSQTTVDFTLGLPEGAEAKTQTDGSLIVSRDVEGPKPGVEVFGTFAAPWAVDAAGKNLPTTYSYAKGLLTQKVVTTGATFPVVADPSYALGYYWVPVVYTTFTRAETIRMHNLLPYTALLVPIICAYFKVPALMRLCGLAIGYDMVRLTPQLKYANSVFHRCLKTRMAVSPIVANYFVSKYYTVYC